MGISADNDLVVDIGTRSHLTYSSPDVTTTRFNTLYFSLLCANV